MMIEMTVDSVRENLETHLKVVLLKATIQERFLSIRIADDNAYALASALNEISQPRPLTHDLLKNVINGLGANVERVVVSNVVEDVFYARIDLEINGKHVEFDARPSDAIALAIRTKSPVFAEDWILEQSGFTLENEGTNNELDEPHIDAPLQ